MCTKIFLESVDKENPIGRLFFIPQHRNGNYYYVLNQSMHTETNEMLVNYISLYETSKFPFGTVWSRPHKMWNEIVEGRPRFVHVEPPESIIEKTMQYLNENPF
jgi:hypothetical protein